MYQGLLHAHSLLRHFILLALVVVLIVSLIGWLQKKPYTPIHNRLSLYLFIFTHLQLLVGLILYFVSPFVQFGSQTMKDSTTRYWTVEHILAMLVAIVLITMARITAKKMSDDTAKHRRLFIFNFAAGIIILVMILHSGRPFM